MSKAKTAFVCQQCGGVSPRWLGRCPSCGDWNSLVEEAVAAEPARGSSRPKSQRSARVQRLGEVKPDGAERLVTGIAEFDRVLGGGLVPGGVVLIGGDPGIGKSTLVLQALGKLAAQGVSTFYASGEESVDQVALRAARIDAASTKNIAVQATSELEEMESALAELEPRVAVVDSIQTLRSSALNSSAGSVAQLREVTARLVDGAKGTGVALLLIGHVTKDGMLAGPKVLEHLVDTVLSFEGDRTHAFRVVRTTKNRFGAAHEVGVFEMVAEGLREVPDPSSLLLAERPHLAAGSLVVPTADGSRPLLVELQALVAPAVYGATRRVASGLDPQRLAILLAVLERKAGVQVLDRDVFASIAGGLRVDERAVDLALAIAVASSLRDRPVHSGLVVFGEVGLAGEVRAVPRPGIRLAESRKMGFTRAILPKGNAERLTSREREGLELVAVSSLGDALHAALDKS